MVEGEAFIIDMRESTERYLGVQSRERKCRLNMTSRLSRAK